MDAYVHILRVFIVSCCKSYLKLKLLAKLKVNLFCDTKEDNLIIKKVSTRYRVQELSFSVLSFIFKQKSIKSSRNLKQFPQKFN